MLFDVNFNLIAILNLNGMNCNIDDLYMFCLVSGNIS